MTNDDSPAPSDAERVLREFREDEEIRLHFAESARDHDDETAYSRGVEILDLLILQVRALRAPQQPPRGVGLLVDWLVCRGGWQAARDSDSETLKAHILRFVSAPQQPPSRDEGFDEVTETRWQGAIHELCDRLVPEARIDGSGCESGDALDVTLAEIRQVLLYFRSSRHMPTQPCDSMREAAEEVGAAVLRAVNHYLPENQQYAQLAALGEEAEEEVALILSRHQPTQPCVDIRKVANECVDAASDYYVFANIIRSNISDAAMVRASALEEAAKNLEDHARHYPEDVFVPGGESKDAVGADAIRHILKVKAADLRALAPKELRDE